MQAFLEFALEHVRQAGQILMSYYHQADKGIRYKGPRDPVTAADLAAERFLVGAITQTYPEHQIISEESPPRQGSSAFKWIIDPLDGTVNFACQLPYFAVSMALAQDHQIKLGVTYAPYLDEMFWAIQNGGAYFNKQRMQVSNTRQLSAAVLSTGFAYDLQLTAANMENFKRLAMKTRGLRRAGAACIDLAYVACGRLDGHWELGLKPHDIAAGSLMITEAGGRVTDMHGGPNYLYGPHLLASNSYLHTYIQEQLA